jgi:hypothetical protein
MIKIIDNFLTKSYHKNILHLLTSVRFEWGYVDDITGAPTNSNGERVFNGYGFTHPLWVGTDGAISPRSPYFFPMLCQILDVTNCDLIWRARVDMVTWSGKEDFIHPPHEDFRFPNTAAVFYINESDGDTIFYNVKPSIESNPNYKDLKEYDRVSPKANRLVMFDGELLHTGCSPTKHKNRILINSNYIKKEHKEEAEENHKKMMKTMEKGINENF